MPEPLKFDLINREILLDELHKQYETIPQENSPNDCDIRYKQLWDDMNIIKSMNGEDSDLYKRLYEELYLEYFTLIERINEVQVEYLGEVFNKLQEIEPTNWTDSDAEIAECAMWQRCRNIVKEEMLKHGKR